MLRLNPGARGKHLTRQLSWVAVWLLVTRVCPVYLAIERWYFEGVYLLLGGRWARNNRRVVSWEGGKGVWGEWGEKGEKGEKAGKGGIKVRCHGWRGRNVMRRQFGKGGRVVSRKGGMEFNDKIVLYCSREAKCKQGFTAGIWYYLYDILDYQSYTDIGDLMVSTFDLRWGDRGSFPGWRRYEFAFQLFLGF